MKNKYGIGFFAAAIIAVLAVSSAYQLSYQKAKERAQTQVTKNRRSLLRQIGADSLCGWTGAKRRLLLSDGSQRLRGRISE